MGFPLQTASVIVTLFALGGAYAQPKYSQIEVGTVLTDAIGMGFLTRSLPLPPGQWEVVGKSGGEAGVSGGETEGVNSTPTLTISAKNSPADSPLAAFVVAFLPDTMPLIYNNSSCDLNGTTFVDSLESRAGDTLFACARIFVVDKFQSFVSQTPNSQVPGVKETFSALAPHATSLPDNVIGITVMGNRDLGRHVRYLVFLKQEGDFLKDPAYATHIKEWTHVAGMEIKKYLDNGSARIPPLQPYKAN